MKEQTVTLPVADDDLELEGVWVDGGSGGAVVAPPHPQMGGSLRNPVVAELVRGMHPTVATLRFNWRGIEGSQGVVTGDLDAAERDYRAALDFSIQRSSGPYVAAGYSFGAATAVRVAASEPRIEALVLVAPPPVMLDASTLRAIRARIHLVVGEHDHVAPVEELEKLFAGRGAELCVVPGGDHFFGLHGLSDVARTAKEAVSGD